MSDSRESEVFQHFGAYSGYDQSYYSHFNVKRGLRNADGTGVVAGITSISNVHGYLTDEGVDVYKRQALSRTPEAQGGI